MYSLSTFENVRRLAQWLNSLFTSLRSSPYGRCISARFHVSGQWKPTSTVARTNFIRGHFTAVAALGPRPFEPLWLLSIPKPADDSSTYLIFGFPAAEQPALEPIAHCARNHSAPKMCSHPNKKHSVLRKRSQSSHQETEQVQRPCLQ